jgi:hypothetical protein
MNQSAEVYSMRLYRVIVPVRDIEPGAQFYSAVLGETGRRVSGGRHYFGDQSSGAILACYSPATTATVENMAKRGSSIPSNTCICRATT